MTDTVRYTIEVATDVREALIAVSKEFKLTQGEIIDELLNHLDREKMIPIFIARRQAKVSAREDKKEDKKKLTNLLRSLTPEQIAELQRRANEK